VQYLQFLQLIRHLLTIHQTSAFGFAQMATTKSTLPPPTQGEKLKVIIVRLTDEQKDQANKIAAESGATVSELIRRLLNKTKTVKMI